MTTTPAAVDPVLARRLIESDVRYFELGARVERVGPLRLAWMPGLADVPAGCVVLDADGLAGEPDPFAALDAIAERVRAVGGTHVRLYLGRASPRIEVALAARGLAAREETGYLVREAPPAPRTVALEEVTDAAAWERKADLHRASPDFPDGHAVPPERGVELERRKAADGGMRIWLIRSEGAVAGSVGTIAHGEILRLKNLLVHRDLRRRGVATGALARLIEMAESQRRTLGLFAVTRSPAVALYQRPGIVSAVRWIEWMGPAIDPEEWR